jgi:hypothetical protein
MKNLNTTKITSTFLSAALFSLLSISCTKKEGCTDPLATNFDVEAESDDGSCNYPAATPNSKATITFNFTHHFDGEPVSSSNFDVFNFVNANNDTLSLSKLRYLISDVKLSRPNGDIELSEGYNLVDVKNNSGLNYTISDVDLGTLNSIDFNFGFDSLDNTQNYVDLNSANWGVPMMMGGGYHGMQMEGMYKNEGADSVYAYHHIVTKRPTMMGEFEANHIPVSLSGIDLTKPNIVIEVQMNIAEWFKSPNTWDLNTYHSSLMMNYTAQTMMKENGLNVFSLGTVIQNQ